MALEFEISTGIKASAGRIYKAWLSSKGHSAMTGGEAHIADKAGADFDA